jgi:rare lipoprotein A
MRPGSAAAAFAASAVLISGCSWSPPSNFDASSVPNAVPKPVTRGKRGNPDSYVVLGRRYYVLESSTGYDERGIASWYGPGFDGKSTSSGETYDMYKMTAAHKTLPLPTYARVTNLANDKSVIVKVNDRGPFHENRIIDLSYAAAAKLGMIKKGTALVDVKAISTNQPPSPDAVAESKTPPAALPANPELYVQVGAYAKHDNARRMQARLALNALGPVVIERASLADGQHVWRVRIGPLTDVDAVDALTRRLGELGIDQTQVVIP